MADIKLAEYNSNGMNKILPTSNMVCLMES